MIRPDIFGYFYDDLAETPCHDPGPTAPCPVCAKPVNYPASPVVTISLMPEDPALRQKSYFFRSHAACWKPLPDAEKTLIEASLIDKLYQP